MNLKSWYPKRGAQFVIQRASSILNRYGVTPLKATSRIEESLMILAQYGCFPTFFTPGIVVERYSQFIKRMQAKGAEIAVHSYQHIDLNSLPLAKARDQLSKAINTFNKNGIEVRGFRCPYLSYSEELLESLSEEFFGYSSNRAIWLDVAPLNQNNGQSVIYNTLRRFYNPISSTEKICTPYSRPNMIEIPICIPDDLQLHDGLSLDSEGISQAWIEMLHQTYQRGELFNLIFHPELGSVCKQSFEDLLRQAIRLKPSVWIARLCEISEWWREKSKFYVQISPNQKNLNLTFDCSPRATILVRNLNAPGSVVQWDGEYSRLLSNTLEVPGNPRPFLGLTDGIPERVVSFLHEQGYILNFGETARFCGLILDPEILTKLRNDVELVNYIESAPTPLVRIWRWPNGSKSALCITGDLDALTLYDYVSRIFTH